MQRLNNPDSWHLVEDKATFNALFSDFLHRNWLDLRTASLEDFADLVDDPTVLYVSLWTLPVAGIEFIETESITDLPELYHRLKAEEK